MLIYQITHQCNSCESRNLVKNGFSVSKKQKYICKNCGFNGVVNPERRYTEAEKEMIMNAYQERSSMRGVCRIFGVGFPTLSKWLKSAFEANKKIEDTLLKATKDDVLELDEVWSFVKRRKNKKWLWVALCRRTKQVVAYVLGDRSESSCKELWNKIPDSYKKLHTYSDFWHAYEKVFPKETHRSVGKESGLTNHIERWNNTLRQWVGRYTRETLSFSKSDYFHELVTHLFIRKYNLSKSTRC